MREYARQLSIRRWIIPVPFLTARLSCLWLGLATPVYARVGRKLIDSLPHETVVRSANADQAFPIDPCGYREAIARALANEDRDFAESRWSDAALLRELRPGATGAFDMASVWWTPTRPRCESLRRRAFRPIRRIGGERAGTAATASGGCAASSTCSSGGVGARRGRRDPQTPAVGSALDFWRVEAYEPNCLLRLHAEMKLPGRAWLQFEVTETTPAARSARPQSSTRAACSAPRTGTASSPSTPGSSREC